MKTTSKTIHIGGNYYLAADRNQYTIKEIGKREKIDKITRKPTGEIVDYEVDCGYFMSISSALLTCVDIMTREEICNGEITTLSECCKFVNESYKDIKEKLNSF